MDLAGMIALPGFPANGAASAATSSATGDGAAKDGNFMAILAGATGDITAASGRGADLSAPDGSVASDGPILSLDAAIASLMASAGMTLRPDATTMTATAGQGAAAAASVQAGPAVAATPAAPVALAGAAVEQGAVATAGVPVETAATAGAALASARTDASVAAAVPQAAEASLRAGREAGDETPRTAIAAAAASSSRTSSRTAASGADAGAQTSSAPQTAAAPAPSVSQPVAAPAAPAATPALDSAALPDADIAAMDPMAGEITAQAPSDPRSSSTAAASAAATPAAAPRWTAHTTAHLAVQMTRRAEAGVTNFAIRLDPAELGRIEVRLSIGADQRVRASLTVERPETLAEVMRASRDLVDALADAGLMLDEGGLSVALDDRSSRRGAPDREASKPSQTAGAAETDTVAPLPAAERWSRGRIDLTL
jgi:flagellar hook-length control protein FliK